MSLFGKKSKEEIPELPKLPELPSLPSFPSPNLSETPEEIHHLPSFPTTRLGEKFSQDTIKNAIGDEEKFEMPELELPTIPTEKIQDISKPINLEQKFPNQSMQTPKVKEMKTEPVFIRLDKFQEALEIFENAKEKMGEIESLLHETKELKEKEEQELAMWALEMQNIQKEIEKIDKDVFSKI